MVQDQRFKNRVTEINTILMNNGIGMIEINFKADWAQMADFAIEYMFLQAITAQHVENHLPGIGCKWVREFPFVMANQGNIRNESIEGLKAMLEAQVGKRLPQKKILQIPEVH